MPHQRSETNTLYPPQDPISPRANKDDVDSKSHKGRRFPSGVLKKSSLKQTISKSAKKAILKHKKEYLLESILDSPQRRLLNMARRISYLPNEFNSVIEEKLEREYTIREGTMRLLAACKKPLQILEAAKSLQTSSCRMLQYMAELQRFKTMQVIGDAKQFLKKSQEPCKAKVAISDLSIPLIWKGSDHFMNKGDYRRYAVFCIARLGTEVLDTALCTDVDRSCTDITFDEVLLFREASPQFECRLEVYASELHEDLTMASKQQKVRRKIGDMSASLQRTLGRRISSTCEELESSMTLFGDFSDLYMRRLLELQRLGEVGIYSNLSGPRYDLVASATLNLSNAKDTVQIFDFQRENNNENTAELPLFGNYCARLVVQPYCLSHDFISGPLCVQMSSNKSWMHCKLRRQELDFWHLPPGYRPPSVHALSNGTTSGVQESSAEHLQRHGAAQTVTPVEQDNNRLAQVLEAKPDLTLTVECGLSALERGELENANAQLGAVNSPKILMPTKRAEIASGTTENAEDSETVKLCTDSLPAPVEEDNVPQTGLQTKSETLQAASVVRPEERKVQAVAEVQSDTKMEQDDQTTEDKAVEFQNEQETNNSATDIQETTCTDSSSFAETVSAHSPEATSVPFPEIIATHSLEARPTTSSYVEDALLDSFVGDKVDAIISAVCQEIGHADTKDTGANLPDVPSTSTTTQAASETSIPSDIQSVALKDGSVQTPADESSGQALTEDDGPSSRSVESKAGSGARSNEPTEGTQGSLPDDIATVSYTCETRDEREAVSTEATREVTLDDRTASSPVCDATEFEAKLGAQTMDVNLEGTQQHPIPKDIKDISTGEDLTPVRKTETAHSGVEFATECSQASSSDTLMETVSGASMECLQGSLSSEDTKQSSDDGADPSPENVSDPHADATGNDGVSEKESKIGAEGVGEIMKPLDSDAPEAREVTALSVSSDSLFSPPVAHAPIVASESASTGIEMTSQSESSGGPHSRTSADDVFVTTPTTDQGIGMESTAPETMATTESPHPSSPHGVTLSDVQPTQTYMTDSSHMHQAMEIDDLPNNLTRVTEYGSEENTRERSSSAKVSRYEISCTESGKTRVVANGLECAVMQSELEEQSPDIVIPINKDTVVRRLDTAEHGPCLEIIHSPSLSPAAATIEAGDKSNQSASTTTAANVVRRRCSCVCKASSPAELDGWCSALQQHLLDQAEWKHALDTQMEIPTVSTSLGLPQRAHVSGTALYNDIVIGDSTGGGTLTDLRRMAGDS